MCSKLMTTASAEKPFGILVELPDNDPFSAPHLLGDKWSGARWFDTAQARDEALASMQQQPGNYRKGDKPSVRLTKVDPD